MNPFRCSVCRAGADAWSHICPTCGRWNSLAVAVGPLVVKSTSADAPQIVRVPCGVGIFDEILLGGVVVPSCILITGIAGAGKSTLILQVAGGLARAGLRVAYVCAEEGTAGVVERARRVEAAHDNLDLIATSDPTVALRVSAGYDVAVYDSIQKLGITADLIHAPQTRILVSQMNKAGVIQGESTNEHEPDVLLYCHFDSENGRRDLECCKNRHGELKKAAYNLTALGAVGICCAKCGQCVMPCKCPPRERRKRKNEDQLS